MIGLRAKPSLPPAIRGAANQQQYQDADNRKLDGDSQGAPGGKEKQHNDDEDDQAGGNCGKHVGAQASSLPFAGILAGPLPTR